MLLFKTSGDTIESVVRNQKNAFLNEPRRWFVGELVLISKNKNDCKKSERQIQFISEIEDIRPASTGEVEKYWPGNEGRWNFIVLLRNTRKVPSFNLEDAIGEYQAQIYKQVISYKKFEAEHEDKILRYLNRA